MRGRLRAWMTEISTRKFLLLSIGAVLFAVGVAAPVVWSRSTASRDVLAKVNGEPVTRVDLQRALADSVVRAEIQQEVGAAQTDDKRFERQALRKVIVRRLLLQEARRRNFTVDDRELDQMIAGLRERLKAPGEFEAWLKARGLTDATLRDATRADMLISQVRTAVISRVQVTPAQVQAYYEAHKDEIQGHEQVRLRVFAGDDRVAAQAVIAAMRKGEAFETLARDAGWRDPERLPPPVRQAVATLKPGETSGLVESGNRFFIIRVVERRPAGAMTLAEAQPQIARTLLAAEQRKAAQAWLAEAEKNAKIEVFERQAR